MSDNKISNIRPSFEDLTQSLIAHLAQNPSWTDLLPYSAGRSLIEFVAAVGTMLNYSVEKSVQETYMDTALLDKSIYRAARLLGISPARMTSARVTCNLTIEGSANIPAFSQFAIDGDSYYNMEAIIHPSPGLGQGVVENVVLYQGSISRKKFLGTGAAYQTLVIGSNFTVAENFLDVRVAGTQFVRQKEPLWNTTATKVFQDRTKPEGSTEIIFGNGLFGEVPALNSQITVTYAECKGAAANKAVSGLKVTFNSNVQGITALSGVTLATALGSPSNGRDYDTAEYLKYTAPRLFAANKRAVRRDDWRTLALTYPDKKLADALVWGEHEQRFIDTNSFGPLNLNVVRVAILAESGNLTASDVTAFKAYLEQFKTVNSQLIVTSTAAVRVRLSLRVYVTGDTMVATVNDAVLLALRTMFSRKRGSLGKNYHPSDITRLVCTETSVDYCEIISVQFSEDNGIVWQPMVNSLSMKPLQYAVLDEPISLVVQTTQRGD